MIAYQNEFLPAYSDVSGEEEPIAAFHAHAYDAYNIVADAIEAVGIEEDGTLYIPRTALRDYLAELTDYEGLTGIADVQRERRLRQLDDHRPRGARG